MKAGPQLQKRGHAAMHGHRSFVWSAQPATRLNSVLLPAPLEPTTPTVWPAGIRKVMFRSATNRCFPSLLRNRFR